MPKRFKKPPLIRKRDGNQRQRFQQKNDNIEFRERLGVDVVDPTEESDFTDAIVIPSCSHGKCLLFKLRNEPVERWFGCSLHRSESVCSFKCLWPPGRPIGDIPKVNPAKLPIRVKVCEKIRELSTFYFCHRCLDAFPEQNTHFHGLTGPYDAAKVDLFKLIMPIESDESQAQYWFDKDAVSILSQSILSAKKTHFLCIGTPQIFNFIRSNPKYQNSVYLLDIDERFRAIYDDDHFSMFNMVNGEFWSNESGFTKFLNKATNLVVICDPPFAIFIKVLLKTLQKLTQAKSTETDFVFTMPYFLDKHLFREMPNINMIDYAITYQNHRKFKTAKNSPVRFFTTLSPRYFVLPADEYKQCVKCDRYVAKNNEHCYDCKACPSRDGSPVHHCLKCQRCVPLKYRHCNKCETCSLNGRCHAK